MIENYQQYSKNRIFSPSKDALNKLFIIMEAEKGLFSGEIWQIPLN